MNLSRTQKAIGNYIYHQLHGKEELQTSTSSRNWEAEFKAEAYRGITYASNEEERKLFADTTVSFQRDGITFHRDKPNFSELDNI